MEFASADPHYNSSLNKDPLAIAGYDITVRCFAVPSLSSAFPPASHMQGSARATFYGDGFRDGLEVSMLTPVQSQQSLRTCDDVVVVSDEELNCALPSAQYGYADVVLTLNTSTDELVVNCEYYNMDIEVGAVDMCCLLSFTLLLYAL